MYRDFEQRLCIDWCSGPPFIISLYLLEDTECFSCTVIQNKTCRSGGSYLYDGDQELVLFDSAEISFRIPATGRFFFPVTCSHKSCLRTKQCL